MQLTSFAMYLWYAFLKYIFMMIVIDFPHFRVNIDIYPDFRGNIDIALVSVVLV